MQRQMEEAQKELEEKEITAAAGGGAVEVTVSGKREITKVKLSEEVVDPDDIEMLEDLIMAATNEALRQLEEFSSRFHVKNYRRHGWSWRTSILRGKSTPYVLWANLFIGPGCQPLFDTRISAGKNA